MVAISISELDELREKCLSVVQLGIGEDIFHYLEERHPQNLSLLQDPQVYNAVFDSKGNSPHLARIALEILLTRPDLEDLVVATNMPVDPESVSAELERRGGSFGDLNSTDIVYYLSFLGVGSAIVNGEDGFVSGRMLSDVKDYFLRTIYDKISGGVNGKHALFVRGSHGRRLVAPFSDLDIIVIGESESLEGMAKMFYRRIHQPHFMDLDYGNEDMPLEHELKTRGFKQQVDLSTNPNEAPYTTGEHFITSLGDGSLEEISVLKALELRFIAGDEEYAKRTLSLIWERLYGKREELMGFAKRAVNEKIENPSNLGQALSYALLAYRLYRSIDYPTPDLVFDDLQKVDKGATIKGDIDRAFVKAAEFQFRVRSQSRILYGSPFIYAPNEPPYKDPNVFLKTFGYDQNFFDLYQYAKDTIRDGIKQIIRNIR